MASGGDNSQNKKKNSLSSTTAQLPLVTARHLNKIQTSNLSVNRFLFTCLT